MGWVGRMRRYESKLVAWIGLEAIFRLSRVFVKYVHSIDVASLSIASILVARSLAPPGHF
jgi:hypothetical protein